MEQEKRQEFPDHIVVRKAVESKSEFLAQIDEIAKLGGDITEFHFIGHSGMYGIMFGTTKWPEQFSPYEWKQMRIPFAPQAKFCFHACRTGRWFGPFIARTFGVKTCGYYWYTTFSTSKRRFQWPGPPSRVHEKLFVVSCPGKKSHGILASGYKYSARPRVYPMLEFSPDENPVDGSYDSIAELYDQTFVDIGVRGDEWKWLTANLGDLRGKRLLDIGCGNGALLKKLSEKYQRGFEGAGVDASGRMIEQAARRCAEYPNLLFRKINGPFLPFDNNSFDCIISLLSFRYLDWDPILKEILRVLKAGGETFVLDMVAAPVKVREFPQFMRDKISACFQRMSEPAYFRSLSRMVKDPRWAQMLKYNPMRAEHEMKWYLESRFADHRVQVINVGWNSRILAFRSGPVSFKSAEPMRFP
jgi:ubiquinone/menaquinone biosynthesis C-methylase UbiE